MKYPNKTIYLTDSDFRITIEKFPLVVVDCCASWSNPCIRLSSTIDKMAKSKAGKIVFGRINVNVNRITANRFDIMSVPTLLIFKEGVLVDRIVGAVPRGKIEKKIKSHLMENS